VSWCLNVFIFKLQLYYYIPIMLDYTLALVYNNIIKKQSGILLNYHIYTALWSCHQYQLVSTLYSFSFVLLIVHRFESLLKGLNLEKMQLHHYKGIESTHWIQGETFILVDKRKLKQNIVTVTVIMALIGAFLSTDSGKAGLSW
jgi:hypothetical protein